jgi:hypothetical protein
MLHHMQHLIRGGRDTGGKDLFRQTDAVTFTSCGHHYFHRTIIKPKRSKED